MTDTHYFDLEVTKLGVANLAPELKQEILDEIRELDRYDLVNVIATCADDRIVSINVSSPLTLEEYRHGGYIALYHLVGDLLPLIR